jgi:hypothetical protein
VQVASIWRLKQEADCLQPVQFVNTAAGLSVGIIELAWGRVSYGKSVDNRIGFWKKFPNLLNVMKMLTQFKLEFAYTGERINEKE